MKANSLWSYFSDFELEHSESKRIGAMGKNQTRKDLKSLSAAMRNYGVSEKATFASYFCLLSISSSKMSCKLKGKGCL